MRRLLTLFCFAALAALMSPVQAQRAQYESLVAVHAKANNVPEALVHRVIVRESKYHADLVGRGGTIGLMQIKLATARGLGYTGDAEGLRDPATNLSYGIKYLAGAFRAANSDHSRAMHYYASGYYYAAKHQRLEALKHPEPVLAVAPPKDDVKPAEAAAAEPKQAAEPPAEATAEPKAAATPLDIRPKQAAAKPKKPAKKLADAKMPVPRPPAAIAGGANAAKPR
jgi:hypothetical protein